MFLIAGAARSGTTSLASILDRASNATVKIEPVPNLNTETRLAMEGQLPDIAGVVSSYLSGKADGEDSVYGEKQITLAPFIQEIARQSDCQFVYIHRDGRDVVRSMIDWHDLMFGSIYRECRETGTITPGARQRAAALLVHNDSSDFSRIRPLPGDPFHSEWAHMSRAEMSAYYWSRTNDLYADAFDAVDPGRVTRIDYTNAGAEGVLAAARMAGLTGLDRETVEEMLKARINSSVGRAGGGTRSPHWTSWSSGERASFERIAGDTMHRLGYWTDRASRWRPRNLDADRASKTVGSGRAALAGAIKQTGAASTLEFGPDREDTAETADLAYSIGGLDRTFDIELLLARVAASARKAIFLTADNGWYPELEEHCYRYDRKSGKFSNMVSPSLLSRTFVDLGWAEVKVEPATGGASGPGTRVFARKA
jgi:hypothetical protein